MDRHEFLRLHQLFAKPLWVFLRKSCQDDELAQDIFQETMTRFLSQKLKDPEDVQIKSYLFRIAINLMNDEYRRKQRAYRSVPSLEEEARRQPPMDDLSLDMDRLFSKLGRKERSLLWLSAVEGYSHREIAVMLNLGEPSIRVLLFRIKKKFATILKGEGL